MKPLHLTLRQLQIFVAIAQTGSTTAAAEAVALSQSAVSAALNELERLLATQLFDRVGKRLVLNESGQDLLKQAYPVLDRATQIEQTVNSQSKYLQAVKIGASTTIGNYVLPKLLQQLVANAREPLVWNTEILIHNTADICQKVATFELDLGLIEGSCPQTDQLQSHPWRQDEMVVVMAPQHPLAQAIKTNAHPPSHIVALLRQATWLLRERGSGTRDVSNQMLLPILGHYHNSLELNSSEAIKQGVLYGLGLACLSHWVVEEELKQSRLVRLNGFFPVTVRTCTWICHPSKYLNASMQQVLRRLDCVY